jgi:hypothetical protein
MRLLPILAAAFVAAALAAPAAQAASDEEPILCEGISCIPPFPEDDLPQPIEEPDVPEGPGDGPNLPLEPNSVCTAKVTIDGATTLAHLTDLKACPGTKGFNLGKLAVLAGPVGGPRCDRRDDVVRLRYTVISGGTTLRPEIGECVRGGTVLFSLDL